MALLTSHSLSEDLYTRAAHFLLELIQNADDNEYGNGVVPAIHISMQGLNMTVRCNETGFTEENIRAICSIGNSTKKKANTTGYIGTLIQLCPLSIVAHS